MPASHGNAFVRARAASEKACVALKLSQSNEFAKKMLFRAALYFAKTEEHGEKSVTRSELAQALKEITETAYKLSCLLDETNSTLSALIWERLNAYGKWNCRPLDLLSDLASVAVRAHSASCDLTGGGRGKVQASSSTLSQKELCALAVSTALEIAFKTRPSISNKRTWLVCEAVWREVARDPGPKAADAPPGWRENLRKVDRHPQLRLDMLFLLENSDDLRVGE